MSAKSESDMTSNGAPESPAVKKPNPGVDSAELDAYLQETFEMNQKKKSKWNCESLQKQTWIWRSPTVTIQVLTSLEASASN